MFPSLSALLWKLYSLEKPPHSNREKSRLVVEVVEAVGVAMEKKSSLQERVEVAAAVVSQEVLVQPVVFGRGLCTVTAHLDRKGNICGHLERFGGFFGAILEPSGTILAQLVPFWGYLGTLFRPFWVHFGLLGAILSHLRAFLGPRVFF